MIPFIGQYLQFSQIYSEKTPSIEEIEEYFSKFNSSQLLQLLCKANIAIWRTQNDYKLLVELERNLVELMLPKDIATKTLDLMKSIGTDEKTLTIPFHRHQLLYAIKLALKNPNNGGVLLNDDKTTIGKYLLAINNHLEVEDYGLIKNIDILDFENVRKAISRLFYFSHNGRFVNNISRAIVIWLQIRKSAKFTKKMKAQKILIDLDKEFEEETGLSIEEFLTIGFAYLAHLNSISVHTENPFDFVFTSNFWTQTKLPIKKQLAVQSLLSQNLEDFNKNYSDSVSDKLKNIDIPISNFLPLVDAPILNLSPSLSICSDPQYLEEKMSTGVYWILHNKFKRKNEKSKMDSLSKYYGFLHEAYVELVYSNICDDLIPIKTKPDGKIKTCDFVGVIKQGDMFNLLFIESKKIALSLPMVLLGEKDTSLHDLQRIFGEKGFEQVYSTIQQYEQNKLEELKHIPLDKVKGIYPLLAIDRLIVEDSLNRNFYEREFLNKTVSKYQPILLPETIARPIFISSEEIELIEAAKQHHYQFDFMSFLEHRNTELNKRSYRIQRQFLKGFRLPDIGDVVENLNSIWNELYLIGYSTFINSRLEAVFSKFARKLKDTLFPKQP